MLPAAGCVTARAKAVATAASTALPPFCRIATPTSLAGPDTETTMPLLGFHRIGGCRLSDGRQGGNGAAQRNANCQKALAGRSNAVAMSYCPPHVRCGLALLY